MQTYLFWTGISVAPSGDLDAQSGDKVLAVFLQRSQKNIFLHAMVLVLHVSDNGLAIDRNSQTLEELGRRSCLFFSPRERVPVKMRVTLPGEFVKLRPLESGDAEITLAWRAGSRAKFLNSVSENLETQRAWISSRPAGEFNFIIELIDGQPVGMLSLVNISQQHQHGESARFLIGDEKAVRGVPAALEAMLMLYRFAFYQLHLNRVFGTIADENKMMIRWQKYLGMKEEGRLRQHYFINEKWQDAVCLGILKPEFEADAEPKMLSLIAAARRQTKN